MTIRQSSSGRVAAAAAAAALLACAWRFLTFTGFSNDHYVHLARAQQLLLGAWPVRDFVDPGMPLMYISSAAARLVFGPELSTEFALVAAAFAAGAAATTIAAARLTGSVAVAAIVTALEIAITPRTYSYPKVLLYALGACAILSVAARPSRRHIVIGAVLTAVAFLFRHDHGVFLGAGIAAALVVASRGEGWSAVLGRPALYAAVAALLLAPWALYVAVNGGLLPYLRAGLEFSRAEARGTRLPSMPRLTLSPGEGLLEIGPAPRPLAQVEWAAGVSGVERRALERQFALEPVVQYGPSSWGYHARDTSEATLRALADHPDVRGTSGLGRLDRPLWRAVLAWLSPARVQVLPGLRAESNAQAWLFYLFHALPVVALVAVWRRATRRTQRGPGETAAVVGLAVLAVLANSGFLRDTLKARLPDVIVPAALLGGWLLAAAWRSDGASRGRRIAARAMAAMLLVATTAAVAEVADLGEQVDRAGFEDDAGGVRARAAAMRRALGRVRPEGDMMPSRVSAALVPFYGYLERCTADDDRLLLTSLFPDVFVLGRRGFAGGHIALQVDFFMSPEDQARTIERLRRESVPFVLLVLDSLPAVQSAFPLIYRHVSERYAALADLPQEAPVVRVMMERARAPLRADAVTGWPCFR